MVTVAPHSCGVNLASHEPRLVRAHRATFRSVHPLSFHVAHSGSTWVRRGTHEFLKLREPWSVYTRNVRCPVPVCGLWDGARGVMRRLPPSPSSRFRVRDSPQLNPRFGLGSLNFILSLALMTLRPRASCYIPWEGLSAQLRWRLSGIGAQPSRKVLHLQTTTGPKTNRVLERLLLHARFSEGDEFITFMFLFECPFTTGPI